MTAREIADGIMDSIHYGKKSGADLARARAALDWRDFKHDVANRDAIESALLAAERRSVKVKPLEWARAVNTETMSRAQTHFGTYRVWTYYDAGRWFVSLSTPGAGQEWCKNVDDEKAGKATAQADYEARIRSALEPDEDRQAELAAERRGIERAASVVRSYGCGAHDCPVGAAILALPPAA